MKEETHNKVFIAAAIVGLSVIAMLPFMNAYLIEGHDLSYHMARIEGIYHSMASGHYLVRINPIQAMSYGYASGIMYPQLFLYFPAFLRFFGITLVNCYKVFIFLVTLGTSVIAYFSFKRILKSRMAGLLGMALYVLSLYRLTSIYSRAAMGEVLALCFLPLIVYGMYEVLEGDFRKWMWLAIGYTGMIQSHIIYSFYIFLFCLAAACIFVKRIIAEKKRFFCLCNAVMTVLLLNAWFLIPFLEYYALDLTVKTKEEIVWLTAASFSQMFVNTLPADMGLQMDLTSTKGELIQSIGWLLVFTTILFVVKPKEKDVQETNRTRRIGLFFLGFGLFSIWMSSIAFPWKYLMGMGKIYAILGKIQFAWRLLGFATLFLSVVGAIGLTQWIEACRLEANWHNLKRFALMVSLFAVVINARYYLDTTTQRHVWEADAIEGAVSVDWIGSDELYFYKGDTLDELQTRSQFAVSDGVNIEYDGYERYGCRLLIDLNVKTVAKGAYLEIPLYYYPHYKAWLNGSEVEISRGTSGVIRVPISEGSWHLEVDFVEAPLWILGDVVSIITAIILVIMFFLGFLQKRQRVQALCGRKCVGSDWSQ